ncbi:hypothetical protein FQZ97_460250 [compost metagenome]
MRRHHIVRQACLERDPEGFAQIALPFGRHRFCQHDISHQLLPAQPVLGQYHRLAHGLLLQQSRLDLAQLDPEAANLHLVVDPTQIIDQAIRPRTGQVAAAVDPLAVVAERVRHEALRGQPRTVQIAPRHAFPAQVQFAGQPHRQQVQVGIQHIATALAQQGADRRIGRPAGIILAGLPQQRGHHRFGRAVAVEQVLRTQRSPGQVVARLRHRIAAETVDAHRRRVAVALGVFGQLLQVHRREYPQRHAMSVHLGVGLLRQPQAVVADQYPGAVDQRVHPAFMGAIEGERHEVQFAVRRVRFVALTSRPDMRHQRTVGHRHALGLAGRARGVDHVGQVLFRQRYIRSGIGIALPVIGPVHRQGRQALGDRQLRQHIALGQHQRGGAVLHHVQQAVLRIRHIQRHIGAAGLQHSQERHHDLRRTAHGDRHAHFRANAQFDQFVSQTVGLGIELAIGELLVAEDHRHCVRGLPGPIFDQLVDVAVARVVGLGLVPLGQDELALRLTQHRQLGNSLLRLRADRLQQVVPVLGQAFDGRPVEQVRRIGQRGSQSGFRFEGVQGQVEVSGMGFPLQALHPQPRQLPCFPLHLALMVVHHLEQRAVAQATLRLQRLHQLFERQILMRLGSQGRPLHLLQQLTEGRRRLELRIQHLGVDEEPDQPLRFNSGAVGDRHTYSYVVLPAVAMQQYLERRQQQHEHRHALLLSQLFQGLSQLPIQIDGQAGSSVTLHCRTRTVGRHFQHRLLTAQLRLPVVQLPLTLTRVHPVALP